MRKIFNKEYVKSCRSFVCILILIAIIFYYLWFTAWLPDIVRYMIQDSSLGWLKYIVIYIFLFFNFLILYFIYNLLLWLLQGELSYRCEQIGVFYLEKGSIKVGLFCVRLGYYCMKYCNLLRLNWESRFPTGVDSGFWYLIKRPLMKERITITFRVIKIPLIIAIIYLLIMMQFPLKSINWQILIANFSNIIINVLNYGKILIALPNLISLILAILFFYYLSPRGIVKRIISKDKQRKVKKDFKDIINLNKALKEIELRLIQNIEKVYKAREILSEIRLNFQYKNYDFSNQHFATYNTKEYWEIFDDINISRVVKNYNEISKDNNPFAKKFEIRYLFYSKRIGSILSDEVKFNEVLYTREGCKQSLESAPSKNPSGEQDWNKVKKPESKRMYCLKSENEKIYDSLFICYAIGRFIQRIDNLTNLGIMDRFLQNINETIRK